jgi:hypothetical protein
LSPRGAGAAGGQPHRVARGSAQVRRIQRRLRRCTGHGGPHRRRLQVKKSSSFLVNFRFRRFSAEVRIRDEILSLSRVFFTSSRVTRIGEARKRALDPEFKEGGQRNWCVRTLSVAPISIAVTHYM